MMTDERFEFAQKIVKEAGCMLKDLTKRDITSKIKNNDISDLLSNYDEMIERFLVDKINERYENQGFLTEEKTCGNTQRDQMWIIDPIDGTTNFITKQKEYAISLAYYRGSSPVFGLVYDVVQDKMYSGIVSKGAMVNNRKIKSLASNTLSNCVVDVSLSSVYQLRQTRGIQLDKLAKVIRGHRSSGCASLNICKIALGEIDVYMSSKLRSWDYAAAVIILKEVNGHWGLPFNDKKVIQDSPVCFIATSCDEVYVELVNKYLTLNRIG